MNLKYLTSSTNCNEQNVDSAVYFKNVPEYTKVILAPKISTFALFGAHHFTIKCPNQQNLDVFLNIQPIEQVSVKEESKLDDTLRNRKRNWQALLFTNSHEMNGMADLYSKKHKGYRKRWFIWYVLFKSYIISSNCINRNNYMCATYF